MTRPLAAVFAVSTFALAAGTLVADPAPPKLPEPFATRSALKMSKVLGWPADKTPIAPEGFRVTAYCDSLTSPRQSVALPNGDLLVVLSGTTPSKKDQSSDSFDKKAKAAKHVIGQSPNTVVLLRDSDRDGKAEVFELITGLNKPFGMLVLGEHLYVANTDSVVRYPYKMGDTDVKGAGEKILDLPAGGYNNHWTRNLIASPDGKKVYCSVGSATNVDIEKIDQKDERRAAVLEFDPDGKNMRVFAGGLRNPVGLAWSNGTLWTAVNERDELGDDLVPDYITSVKEGGFYGWPYSYFGQNVDPRQKGNRPDLVAKAIVPDVALGAHTASLGLAIVKGDRLPEKYRGGAFVGQRGSWNRSTFAGYRVVFVPFREGKPAGDREDFLTGFIKNDDEVYGRPVGVAEAADGSLIVCDDAGNRVWRVEWTGK